MSRFLLSFICLMGLTAMLSHAQPAPGVIPVATDPTGNNCFSPVPIQVTNPAGNLYTCQNGTVAKATGATAGANAAVNTVVTCQGTLAGSPYVEPTVSGATHACDSAWSSGQGYEVFAAGAVNYALRGPFNLTTAYADPLKLDMWFNSSSTSGSFQPSIATLFVASGGAITTNWWTTATYTNFTNTATSGTAGIQTHIAQLSLTTGYTGPGLIYFAIKVGSSATPAGGANITNLAITGIQ